VTLWMVAASLAGGYCLLRAVQDIRERRIAWAAAGLLSAALILLTPIQSRAIKLDLLPASASKSAP
jgi:hypothetical protein